MAIGESVTYARDFFRLDVPAEWVVREHGPLGVTSFHHPDSIADAYPAGIAIMTLPETGMPLDRLIHTGLFFLTRDLEGLSIEANGEHIEAGLTWSHVIVRGHVMAQGSRLDVIKHASLTRSRAGVLVLALYGTADGIRALEASFDALRRSVKITG